MGLFDKRDKKRKSDDFDSPVEKIDLSAPEPQAAEPVEMTADLPEPEQPNAAPAARKPEPEPEPEPEYDSSFGIQKAIDLMRTLPQDNVELVVQVVKLTLESTKVQISHIIDDASRKQSDIQGRIKVLKEEIDDYEKEIAARKEEISTLEEDFEETTMVKDRLQLAEKITKKEAAASNASKKVDSGGKDSAKASGSVGGSKSKSSASGNKTSVVVKK